MALGPGKYDDACTHARLSTNAQACILVVIGGEKGSGFSVQGPPDVTAQLPTILEHMAKQIRESMQ